MYSNVTTSTRINIFKCTYVHLCLFHSKLMKLMRSNLHWFVGQYHNTHLPDMGPKGVGMCKGVGISAVSMSMNVGTKYLPEKGYNGTWSANGWHTSHWNAFLIQHHTSMVIPCLIIDDLSTIIFAIHNNVQKSQPS